jgi:subtilase family serine protease
MLPDLVESKLVIPARTGAGLTIVVKPTTSNMGAAASPSSSTAIYLSTDAVLDGGDTLLGSRAVPGLPVGTSSTGSTSITIPSIPPGTYYLIAKADGPNAITESDESNNTLAKKILIGPDLQVSVLRAPTSAVAGSTISVSDTTRNSGGITDGTSTVTRYYLSKNASVDASDTVLASRTVPVLGVNAADAGPSINVVIPASTTAGLWHIIAVADATNAVMESNETNNKKVIPITITR